MITGEWEQVAAGAKGCGICNLEVQSTEGPWGEPQQEASPPSSQGPYWNAWLELQGKPVTGAVEVGSTHEFVLDLSAFDYGQGRGSPVEAALADYLDALRDRGQATVELTLRPVLVNRPDPDVPLDANILIHLDRLEATQETAALREAALADPSKFASFTAAAWASGF